MDEIVGYIERITFQNPENGFTIAQLRQPKRSEPTCIVGYLSFVKPGETIRCRGEWKQHLIYGRQFSVDSYQTEAPADLIGIKRYLGSGLIKGIGSKYAAKIVEKFDIDTLNIIDQHPERLLEVEGLGKKRLNTITECWTEQRSIREVMIFLQSHDISPTYAQKVFRIYGSRSIEQVRSNPYRLARDIRGIGFKTADGIAQKMGIPKDSPERIDAGIEYVLTDCSDDGHVCHPLAEFLTLAEQILELDRSLIEDRLTALAQEQRIEVGDLVFAGKIEPFIWLRPLFLAEVGICRQLVRLKYAPCTLRSVDTERAIEWVQKKLTIELADNQKAAVIQSLQEKVQIITGGPGTGKSTITKAILAITEILSPSIILAAPTGRAAKRMSEITGKKARTIHSLLEFDFQNGKFKKNGDNPLECDLIIIDEASMIDTYLMNNLLKAIPSHARAIFVGDINQLPSVGPGNVLKDMIASRCIPVTALTEIFRQAAGSYIITNAHKINNGIFPDIRNLPDSDFFFLHQESPEVLLEQIVNLVSQRLPTKYRFDPIEDIQVLAPMKKGVIGIENLNHVLQEHLNPKGGTPLHWGGKRFMVGDKVMQVRNDHKREVYNGDIGRIKKIDTAEQEVLIAFDDRDVVYTYSDLDDVFLAYAVSIHKYQGSECPCVVIPVHTTHFKLLHRNLLYTGVTRGKKLVVLVGTAKAMSIAVRNDEVKRRYTGLQQALAGAFSLTA